MKFFYKIINLKKKKNKNIIMMNPLINYKQYHNNKTNILIHKVCIPLLLVTFYSTIPYKFSFLINCFYSSNFLLFDVFSSKSKYCVLYLQVLYLIHILFKKKLSKRNNVFLHGIAWLLQIIGHHYFEHKLPALVDNLYESLIFGPYLIFLETFYSFKKRNKSFTIINKKYDPSKKTIVYIAGLFQNTKQQFSIILPEFNQIYITVYKYDQQIIDKIMNRLQNKQIHCIVGYSFGGSIALQLKQKQNTPTILISPGGFVSNCLFEKCIRLFAKVMYSVYRNDKWNMIQQYPLYQNTQYLSKDDCLIVSKGDWIHNSSSFINHDRKIEFENISHSNMISIVKKQNIIQTLLSFIS